MRRATIVFLLLSAVALTPVGPAGGQDAPPTPEGIRVADSRADFLGAVTELSADDSGPHTIRLASDIQLQEGDNAVYTGTQPLTIDGHGHTIRGAGTRSSSSVVRVSGKALLTVEDLTVRNAGGGLASDGSIVVRRSRFTGMGTSSVRGFGGQPPSLVIVSGSRFIGNLAGLGTSGQVRATGRVIVTTSTFHANRARTGGAAIFSINDVRVERSTFYGNSSRSGAIIHSQDGDVELVNSTVSGNRGFAAGSPGNGAVDAEERLVLVHTTITGNRMDGDRRGSSAVVAGELVSRSSVLQNRTASCFVEGTTTSSASRATDRSCGFTGPKQGVVRDPGLGLLTDNGGPTLTHRPLSGSPLIDAAGCLPDVRIDQRGVRRPAGPRCDIGAVEVT